MQLHYFPNYVCNNLNKMARSFLKGGHGLSQTCNHVNWNKVTNPRRFGGLGLREARLGNVAMIGKLLWNLLHNKDKLSVQVLSHNYTPKDKLCVQVIYDKKMICGCKLYEWVRNMTKP